LSTKGGRAVTTSGDLLLGMDAHINRDFPFTLCTMGLNGPDDPGLAVSYPI
jgi:hypothetical protein